MDGDVPAVLLRDRDDKFGPEFDRAAQGVGVTVIRTAVRAPNMNAVAERFVGSARRELLDHVLLVDEQHLESLLRQYQGYFNESRPHQGLGQRVPVPPRSQPTRPSRSWSRACSAGFTSTTAGRRDASRSRWAKWVASTGDRRGLHKGG
jgi:putative transposase